VALHFSRSDDQQMALKALKTHFSCTSVREFYAFQNNERYPIASELVGWPIYTLERELERQGVSFGEKGEWKLIENSQYKKSPTYPCKLLIPRSMNKAKLYKSGIALLYVIHAHRTLITLLLCRVSCRACRYILRQANDCIQLEEPRWGWDDLPIHGEHERSHVPRHTRRLDGPQARQTRRS
jgi:hypothetical protein